ncbi:BrnT family toxin [Xanthobacter sp. AM11]|uniref:BrnT family toxin n=1 Tax=Xanthobacter sp. AM11 TaxID=3380643 RepID=UPI0039BF6F06
MKAATNLAKHRVPMRAASRFEWDSALERIDARQPYGEVRCTAIGFIGERLHVMVFTRRGLHVRVISLRKANIREVKFYVEF